jgi:hypothetical protein
MNTEEGVLDKVKNLFGQATNAFTSATGSTSYTPTTSSYTPTTSTYLPSSQYPSSQYPPPSSYRRPTQAQGGKNKGRKRSRKMRGGYADNIALTGYAASAASISDIKSAQPLNIVGGKRRTKKCCRNKHTKSCKKRRR